MTAGPVNRALLDSFFQNPGDIYSDTQTEGAFDVIADQVDENWGAQSLHRTIAILDHPDGSVTNEKIANGTLTADKFAPGEFTNETQNGLAIAELKADFDKEVAPVFNVKGYGAVGNGTNDDTIAINAAIIAASAAGGGTVYFPIGSYLISSTLIIPSNVSLVGTTKRKPYIFTNFNGTAIKIEGQGIRIQGLFIDHAGLNGGSANTGNAIDMISTSTITPAWIIIEDVETTTEGLGINVDGTAGAQAGDIYVRSSVFFRVRTSGNVISAVNVRYLLFLQCSTFSAVGATLSSVSFGANTDNCSWVQGVIGGDFSFGGATFNLVAVNSTSGTYTITGDRFISTGGNILTLTLGAASTNAYINSIIGTYTNNGTNNRNVAKNMDFIPMRPSGYSTTGVSVTSSAFADQGFKIMPSKNKYPPSAVFTMVLLMNVANAATNAEYRLVSEDGATVYGTATTNSLSKVIVRATLSSLPSVDAIIKEQFRSTDNVNAANVYSGHIEVSW